VPGVRLPLRQHCHRAQEVHPLPQPTCSPPPPNGLMLKVRNQNGLAHSQRACRQGDVRAAGTTRASWTTTM
jgi:hypothetical protein